MENFNKWFIEIFSFYFKLNWIEHYKREISLSYSKCTCESLFISKIFVINVHILIPVCMNVLYYIFSLFVSLFFSFMHAMLIEAKNQYVHTWLNTSPLHSEEAATFHVGIRWREIIVMPSRIMICIKPCFSPFASSSFQ